MNSIIRCATIYAKAQQRLTACTLAAMQSPDGDPDAKERCQCLLDFNRTAHDLEMQGDALECDQQVVVDDNLTATCADFLEKYRANRAARKAVAPEAVASNEAGNQSGFEYPEQLKRLQEGATEFYEENDDVLKQVGMYIVGALLLVLVIGCGCRLLHRCGFFRCLRRTCGEAVDEVCGFCEWCKDALSSARISNFSVHGERLVPDGNDDFDFHAGPWKHSASAIPADNWEREPLKTREAAPRGREPRWSRGRSPESSSFQARNASQSQAGAGGGFGYYSGMALPGTADAAVAMQTTPPRSGVVAEYPRAQLSSSPPGSGMDRPGGGSAPATPQQWGAAPAFDPASSPSPGSPLGRRGGQARIPFPGGMM